MRVEAPLEVKICGMREAINIARVAELLPDYLGFIFAPESPRYVGDRLKRETIDSLPPSVSAVGVFRNQTSEFVVDCVQRLGLHVVQLHGAEDVEFVKVLRDGAPSLQIWKAVGISCREDVAALADNLGEVDRLVLDNGAGGTGQTFDWRWLLEYEVPVPFVLAGGLGVENLEAALKIAEEVRTLAAFDLNSRIESEPGIKDVEMVKNILKRVRNQP
jgi:phosphoribosylanthranilate isomerase